ncbi:MlaD family protein [Nocardioides stalactiti]|uniref:MlaD family protein n=1 Tax=Nocardioides stalactiti TaxID=2755356 RepID=UPI0015FF8B18|nr:MlaD family protein [Nocardioides stalactiti]
MTTRRTMIQVALFVIGTLVAACYGAVTLFDAGRLVDPPYRVEAVFERSGGIYTRADVDLLGTRVGRVAEVRPGEDGTTVVVMELDPDQPIPADVTATIASKSAIGEQYVQLTPQSNEGPHLEDGDVIGVGRTSAPPDMAEILADVDQLVSSLPPRKVALLLAESVDAVRGLAPTLGRLLDDTETVADASLAGVEDLTSLIRSANVVLDTQVDLGGSTRQALASSALLTRALAENRGALLQLLVNGARAWSELDGALRDVRQPLARVLEALVPLVAGTADREQALRKALTLFPWSFELGATAIRPCGEYDPRTGAPNPRTCRYDDQGRPIFSGHLALQFPEDPGAAPYLPCTRGYEGTERHYPDGRPMDGGPRQRPDSDPNRDARCTATPDDPRTPNVRGEQNVP